MAGNSINWQLTNNIKEKYNGWTNYETWLTNLWFSEYFDYLSEDGCLTDIRESVEEHMDELIGNERSGFLGDVIGTFMGEVNWKEIESHYIRERELEEEYDEPSDQEMMASFGTKWHDGL